MFKTLQRGLMAGLKTTWTLGKIIFPITVIITILQFTPLFPLLIKAIEPLMQFIGLRGEAAIPLVLGATLNLYAGIAGIMSMDLTVKEVFILAVMMSFAHNLFIESGVALRVGVKLWLVLTVRLGLAFTSALAIRFLWHGGGELAQYGLMPEQAATPEGWGAIALLGLEKAFYGTLQLAMIVIPLMIVVQILRDYHYLEKLSKLFTPFTRVLGVKPNAAMTLVAGITVGLAYGAGIMIQAVEEDGVSRKDATLSLIFLMACHAVVEDTLLFVPLGIAVWPILVIRVVVAITLTMFVAFWWNRAEQKKNKGALPA